MSRQRGDANTGGATAVADPKFRSLGMTGRVFAVLDAVVARQDGDTGVRELAAHLDVSRSAVHRILQTLGELRVVRAQLSGRYDPGPRAMAWAKLLGARHVLLTCGHEELVALEREAGETALLLSYTPGDTFGRVVSSCECGKPIRYTVRIGSKSPLHAGSAGKAILAHLPEQLLTTLDRPALTPSTIDDLDLLRSDLDRIRDRGYSMSIAERIPEAAGVAAAYFRNGELAGAINLTIPRHRMAEGEGMARFGKLVKAAADRLTAVLSAPGAECTAPERAARTIGPVDARAGGSAERRSIVRVAAAFDALVRCPSRGLSVEAFAGEISSGRTTSAQLLRALGELGVARPMGGDRYEPGPELLVWSATLGRGGGIAPVATDLLTELVRDTDESAYVATYDPTRECVVFEAGKTSEKPIQYVIPLGSTAPLHAGAAGKAVLAFSGENSFQAQRLDRLSRATIVDPAALRADLARVRERGYAVSIGERISDASGIAAPFFSDGVIAGAITVTIPQDRFDSAATDHHAARVMAAAAELTRLLSAGTLFS